MTREMTTTIQTTAAVLNMIAVITVLTFLLRESNRESKETQPEQVKQIVLRLEEKVDYATALAESVDKNVDIATDDRFRGRDHRLFLDAFFRDNPELVRPFGW